jgi:uncharacterized protein (TIGR03435 family)
MRMRTGSVRAVVIATAVLCAAAALRAQDAPQPPTKPQRMAQNADPGWDVATVKPSDPNDPRGQHMNMSGRHMMFLDTTVEQFLLLGYGVQKSQLAGEPDWAKTEKWDVDGVPDVEGQPSWPQMQGLMRKILDQRFGMKLHREQRQLPVFALIVAKGGPKITLNTSDPNGMMSQRNPTINGQHTEDIKNALMSELALVLQFHVDRPVVDQTGLKGRYDFILKWTTDESKLPTDVNAAPGLFTAIQEQIGLKLEPVKAPAEVLVIDTVERPTAN